jgi:hypothetical protein
MAYGTFYRQRTDGTTTRKPPDRQGKAMKAWAIGFGALVAVSLAVAACGGTPNGAFGGSDGGPDVTLAEAGHLNTGDGSNSSCNKLTCAILGYTCGETGDGCGGMIDCGTCPSDQACGGGGKFSVCGGSGPCKPKTCTELGSTCGPEGDGCGNLIQCGSCSKPDICGGGGTPSVCGTNGAPHPDGGLDGGPCVPKTCASQNISCGPAGDGCGNVLACGSCTIAGETCGGGAMNGQCGKPAGCVPETCASLGVSCGPIGDGCGGLITSCGTCTAPSICGGGMQPSVCGDSTCTGLCLDQVTCTGGGTTTLSGQVVAGTLPTYGSPDPVPNVLVYVPNSTPSAFSTGVECSACGADVSGSPLIEATTDYQGNFTLSNVPIPPAGTVLPLVIQLGRWRRIFGLGNGLNPGFSVTQCTANTIGQVRMPRTQAEGDIPLTAISTGQIDPMECVLLKMGVDEGEFTDPGVGGRIEMYSGNGSSVDPSTPDETALVPDLAGGTGTLDQYDQVLFPCWGYDPIGECGPGGGGVNCKTANQQANVVAYANGGGRMFATHLSYSWFSVPSTAPFDDTATWVGDPPAGDPDLEYTSGTANIPSVGTSPEVTTFYKWMNALTAGGATGGAFAVSQERNNFSAIGSSSELWATVTGATPAISGEPTTFPAVYTFNTPYGAAAQCGKVIYSDFHVSVIPGGSQDDQSLAFPSECTGSAMSSQEKALEYLIWDLASCLNTTPGPTCTPKTCASVGANCGPIADGCGGSIACGTCSGCETCGGGGKTSVCGGVCCAPESCAAQNIECGPAGDGCGNLIQCGTCPHGLSCGGGGHPGACGSIDAGPVCEPLTCAKQGIKCGPAGDGCGNEIQCGTCAVGEACGAGGQSGVCAPVCVPRTCAQLGFNCGPTGDGCGGELQCGTCKPPQICGGAGATSVCGNNISK